MDITNKVALITGSSRGIGRAIALAFARAGADIVIIYHKQADSANSVVAEIRKLGRRALSLQIDVSSRAMVQGMISRTLETFDRIDVLVNNAGILQQKPFLEISDEDWDRIMDVNLKGAFLCSQKVFPVMQKQKSGAIINMASSGGQLGGPLAVHYSASKAGVICLTKSLARIGAFYGIRVNCIAPGLIDTEMTKDEICSDAGREKVRQIPIQRPGTVDEVARAAVFLASDDASYITGQTVNVNGGLYMG
jgi:NAD(P)-dependent dehydrogenase (short-subunit alcohol dehydrogenase family)